MNNDCANFGFPTVFGRNLIAEMPNFVRPPFLVATMKDLWGQFSGHFKDAECSVFFAESMERQALEKALAGAGEFAAVVGIGGGRALDSAKYFAWRRNTPLFQAPTALSSNAVYGQRSGIRENGAVLYRGWAVPQAVYLDYDVLQSAPRQMNYSGIGDVLCFHTGVLDWRYASKRGLCEEKWPYDEHWAEQSLARVEEVARGVDEIRNMTEAGIRILVKGLSWGTTYHSSGWCPRHIEGIDHFLFYALEELTGVKFLHGPPVCLGVVAGSMLHESRADEMMATVAGAGLDIRPEAMGITWNDVETALLGLRDYVRKRGLWHGIAHDAQIDAAFVKNLRERVESTYRQ